MRIIETAGITVIVAGLALALVQFAASLRSLPFEAAHERLRRQIGHAILLGLEFLVAADIIGTVAVEPTLRSVAALGLIVLVRTFLSMALEVEMMASCPGDVSPEPSTRALSATYGESCVAGYSA